MMTDKVEDTTDLDTMAYSEAQTRLFDISFKAATAIEKAVRAQLKPVTVWLEEQYGDTKPTYEQFWSDRAALASLAKERGLADDQTVRKPYNMAVKQKYGELPLSPSEAAVAKRTTRATLTLPNKAKQEPTKPPTPMPTALTHPPIQLPGELKIEGWTEVAGEADDLDTLASNAAAVAAAREDRAAPAFTPKPVIVGREIPTAEEAVRQLLVDYGYAPILVAFSVVMAEHTETAKEAKRVAQLGQQYGSAHPEEARHGERRANGMH